MKRSLIRIIFLILLIPVVCSGQDMRLGLEETPAELYRSLRLAKPNPANGEKPGLGITDRGVDLAGLMPSVGYQGELNSCTTWAVGYAVKSFQENVERKWGVDSKNHVFSPSFLYNQISEGRNAGTSFQASFAILMEQGIASLASMPYTTNLYENPSAAAFEEARSFKAESYSRVNVSINDIKHVLDQGNCVLVAVKVYDNFSDYRGGIYDSIRGPVKGGHAMVVIGYDEARGALKLINSWSTRWGEEGYCWISYDIFPRICLEAYVLYDRIEATPERVATPHQVAASQGAHSDRIQVVWDRVVNVVAYRVYRKKTEGSDFESAAQTRGLVYLDRNIEEGRKYIYTVVAANETGESDFSEIAVGWASRPKPAAPPPPQSLKARVMDAKLYLKWDVVASAAGYYIYSWDPQRETYRRIGQTRDQGFGENLSDKEPGVVLNTIVTAYNDNGESRASEAVSFTVPDKPEDKEAVAERLLPPERVSIVLEPGRPGLTLSWNTVPGAQWYIILKWRNEQTGWEILRRRVEGTSLYDSEGRRSHYYTVVSANAEGYSDLSEYSGYNQAEYRSGLTFDDVEKGYYQDPKRDTFFTVDLFSDDEIFKTGDLEDFRGTYFDDGFFDDATVSRFYTFFNERRKAFEETGSEKRDAFDSFRDERKDRFKGLLDE